MPAPVEYEIEAKFDCRDAKTLERLETEPQLSSDYLLQTAKKVESSDTYYDTGDYRLLRAGYTLRIRTRGASTAITLKQRSLRDQADTYGRMEIEREIQNQIAPLESKEWPKAVRKIVFKVAGKNPQLQPLCTIAQNRTKRIVSRIPAENEQDKSQDGEPIAELSIDRVRVFGPTQAAEDGPTMHVAHFNEVEMELLADQHTEALEPLVTLLRKRRSLKPMQTSKAERALLALSRHPSGAPPEAVGLQPRMHVAEACRLIWREQLMEMLLSEFGVRESGDIEYVHEFRVAIRRIRVAATLYGQYFDKRMLRRYRRVLKETARVAGVVRDHDVALEDLALYTKEKATKKKKPIQGKAVKKKDTGNGNDAGQSIGIVWESERQKERKVLLKWLGSKVYRDFVADFSTFCSTSGAGVITQTATDDNPAPLHQVRHVAPLMIHHCFERIRGYEVLFEAQAPVEIDALHRLRIDCKYLRYMLEFNAHLLGSKGKNLIKTLKQLQDHLGNLNDAAVRQKKLASIENPSKMTQKYEEQQHEQIKQLVAQFPPQLEKFIDKKNRLLMAQVLAQL